MVVPKQSGDLFQKRPVMLRRQRQRGVRVADATAFKHLVKLHGRRSPALFQRLAKQLFGFPAMSLQQKLARRQVGDWPSDRANVVRD